VNVKNKDVTVSSHSLKERLMFKVWLSILSEQKHFALSHLPARIIAGAKSGLLRWMADGVDCLSNYSKKPNKRNLRSVRNCVWQPYWNRCKSDHNS